MEIDVKFIKEFYSCFGIQVLSLSSNSEAFHQIDYGLRGIIFPHFNYERIYHRLETELAPGALYFIQDEFSLSYTFYHLPLALQSLYSTRYICIGPLLHHQLTTTEIEFIMESVHFPSTRKDELLSFYNSIPIASSFDMWTSSITCMFSKLTGTDIIGQIYYLNKATKTDYDETISQSVDEPHLALHTLEKRYQAEASFLNAVATGNLKEALSAYNYFIKFDISSRTPLLLRHKKNLLLTFNTLIRKAVEAAQIHPWYIDQLSTKFAINIEKVTSLSELEKMPSLMIHKYCLLVKNHARRNFSPIIHECMNYINFHYTEDLTLEMLSSHFSLSNSYLSTLFKQEVGTTLTEYIQQIRIRRAIFLLNTTQLPIKEISYQCGFMDSNYFTRVFKKLQNISPSDYRNTFLKLNDKDRIQRAD